MPRPFRHPVPAVRPAFTLAELMIVIGIMVLMLALAVPTFNVMTGSRSVENAQNAIAATLAQARLSAIRAQAPRGVCFYRDPASDRIAMAIVEYADLSNFTSPPTALDYPVEVVTETDAQYLPKGIDIAFRHNTAANGSTYVYRFSSGSEKNLRGLILFDSKGHVAYRQYDIGDGTELSRRADTGGHVTVAASQPFYSQPAFLLAERSPVDNASDKEAYLNENATVVLVNRYNGTLTRSE